jgi:DNA gyrase subunit A
MKDSIVDITDEVKSSYLDYAMSVIVSRALPDVRDGLKPVHRRILYSMYASGFFHNKQYKKSARTVGDVIGKYHPHGDSAVYDALVRMAQDFSLRVPLIDGQGNFGSIDGDAPAAMRYTEARLAKVTNKMLEDLAFSTVDFRANYDGSEQEPVVLPSLLPNLLLNGSGGIAVGMATNIPPHNLGQLVDACCLYIDNADVSIEELIEAVEAPDFPTQGVILGIENLHKAYRTGKGIITIKGVAEIESRGEKQKAIVITEIPYSVNKSKLVERIGELIKEGRIVGVSDLRDESDNTGIRVVVELKRDIIPEVILRQIYSYTPLKVSYGINMLALHKGVPRLMNLRDIINAFINFRREVIYRRTAFLLEEARQRAEILVSLFIAVNNLDFVVKLIKDSEDFTSAKARLIEIAWNVESIAAFVEYLSLSLTQGKFYLSERQAKAILEMRLSKLTGLETRRIIEDLENLLESIKEYLAILASESKLMFILKEELLSLKAEFATPRLTKLEHSLEDFGDEDSLIPEEEVVVTFTLKGYVKRVSLNEYKAQRRGGQGKSALNMINDDVIIKVLVESTHADLLFFSNFGQVYRLKLYKLPIASMQAAGKPIVNLLPLSPGEKINNMLPLPRDKISRENMSIIFATSSGQVRRNNLSDFEYIPANGKIAIKLDEGDNLVSVHFCTSRDHVFLATHLGKCIRFSVDELRIFKSRSSDGVRGIHLGKEDRVVEKTILYGTDYTQEQRDVYLSIPVEVRRKMKDAQCDIHVMKVMQDLGIVEKGLDIETATKMASEEQFILSITENGYGKCTSAYEYRTTHRGGSGVVNLAVSRKVGNIVSAIPIFGESDAELMIITNLGKVIRCKLDNIRVTGRNTSGVILVKTKKEEKVVSISLVKNKICEDDE